MFAALIASCKAEDGGGAPRTGDIPGEGALSVVRVKVPQARCEVAIPGNMIIADAKTSGFTIVENGKDPMFHGVLIVMMPLGPIGSIAPSDATDVKVLKDNKGADGTIAREGSYKNAVQTVHVAEYVYPLGKEWLYCNIQAVNPDRRDQVAKVCAGLAPKSL